MPLKHAEPPTYPHLNNKERLVRIELTFSAWQAEGLPLHHRRLFIDSTKFSKIKEHRARIELAQPLYESGVIPLDHQCLFIQWDWRGSNPHRTD